MNRIKKFLQFINESVDSEKQYGLDSGFPWFEEISKVISEIEEKINYIKNNFEYGRHDRHSPVGFEFNIKIRNWPDSEELAQQYGFTEEEVGQMWDLFLSDNLEMYASDFLEKYDMFEGWGQTGRSGGWLLLKPDRHTKYLIEDYEEKIQDGVNELNSLTDSTDLTKNDIVNFIQLEKNGKMGLLQRLGILEDTYEEFQAMKKESADCLLYLRNLLKEASDLESALTDIQNQIDQFWKNCDEYFKDFVSSEKEVREQD